MKDWRLYYGVGVLLTGVALLTHFRSDYGLVAAAVGTLVFIGYGSYLKGKSDSRG